MSALHTVTHPVLSRPAQKTAHHIYACRPVYKGFSNRSVWRPCHGHRCRRESLGIRISRPAGFHRSCAITTRTARHIHRHNIITLINYGSWLGAAPRRAADDPSLSGCRATHSDRPATAAPRRHRFRAPRPQHAPGGQRSVSLEKTVGVLATVTTDR